jgi:P27 family predicted phage terminase small subunit
MIFYNEKAEEYFNQTFVELQEIFIKPIDSVALMNLSNLFAQSQEMLEKIKEEGYQISQTNSRGSQTFQINPNYRAYLSALAEMDKLQSKLGLNVKSRQLLKQKELELKTEEDELFNDV